MLYFALNCPHISLSVCLLCFHYCQSIPINLFLKFLFVFISNIQLQRHQCIYFFNRKQTSQFCFHSNENVLTLGLFLHGVLLAVDRSDIIDQYHRQGYCQAGLSAVFSSVSLQFCIGTMHSLLLQTSHVFCLLVSLACLHVALCCQRMHCRGSICTSE